MMNTHKVHANMAGRVTETPSGFFARPHGLGMEHTRRFTTKGDAVAYNRRMKALLERVRR
ncbi:MAG: hypothetical protein ACWGQW_04290 [bacterium]